MTNTFYFSPHIETLHLGGDAQKAVNNHRVDEAGNPAISLPAPLPGEAGAVITEHAPVDWQEVNGNRVMVAQFQITLQSLTANPRSNDLKHL